MLGNDAVLRHVVGHSGCAPVVVILLDHALFNGFPEQVSTERRRGKRLPLRPSGRRQGKQRVVSLGRAVQDGARIQASAGAALFRRRTTWLDCHQRAKVEVERLRRETGATAARPADTKP